MKKSARPKIEIPLEETDRLLDGLVVASLAIMFAIPALHYAELPEVIPIHFNLKGEADGYAPKAFLWLLPTISSFTCGLMLFLARYPHTFNYPVKITEQNAEAHYRLAARMMRALNAVIAVFFAYLCRELVQMGLQERSTLKPWAVPLLIVGIVGVLVWYFRGMRRIG